ncbi:MAG: MoxR family ATPase [Candidatus Hydrogenedentota bacterium]
MSLQEIQERVEKESIFVEEIFNEMKKVIVGQQKLIERLIIGLISRGHILIEGVPGLAKTLACLSLSKIADLKFQRIQFTPDLLPADLTGSLIYNYQKAEFTVRKGPIFTNILLADEINRSPAKVQSALLEAMQERRVTIGEDTFNLPEPFFVLATENPIEQEGTYPLPEAQVDRFMLKVVITYPEVEEEKIIIDRAYEIESIKLNKVISPERLVKVRDVIQSIYCDDKIKDYVVDLVRATREPEKFGFSSFKDLIEYGASPRASIYLIQCARALAFMRHRGFVTPEDIKAIGRDILRHRIILSYEAEAENVTADNIIDKLFDTIQVP